MTIARYKDTQQPEWDEFIQSAKNSHFFFLRHYMDYHRDRFTDHSLMVYDEKDRLLTVLPANEADGQLFSHGGLTYGGFITDERMRTAMMLDVFEHMLAYLKEQTISSVIYKPLPYIFHTLPAQEDHYALFRLGAQLFRRDLNTVIIPSADVPFQDRRHRSRKKAQKAGAVVTPSSDYPAFWSILTENLKTAHDLAPAHTVDEMILLQSRFPDQIKLFAVFVEEEMVAGTVIYENPLVTHAQYIGSSDLGQAISALDLLFWQLITQAYYDKPYFSFGVSTESGGHHLNKGLAEFKEGFGGRTILHDFYELPVKA